MSATRAPSADALITDVIGMDSLAVIELADVVDAAAGRAGSEVDDWMARCRTMTFRDLCLHVKTVSQMPATDEGTAA